MTTVQSKAPHRSPSGSASSAPRRFKKPFTRRKVCRFCADKIEYIDFKNVALLRGFISDRGKILSGRTTGVCAEHQRKLTRSVKLARNIALIPFTFA